jgi:hypothetical protein
LLVQRKIFSHVQIISRNPGRITGNSETTVF